MSHGQNVTGQNVTRQNITGQNFTGQNVTGKNLQFPDADSDADTGESLQPLPLIVRPALIVGRVETQGPVEYVSTQKVNVHH